VIGVSVDRGGSDDRVQEFATALGVTFTILRDEDNDFSRTFRTLGVPETLLIDRDGEILYRWRGQLDEDNQADRTLIEDALSSAVTDASDAASEVSRVAIPVAFAAGLLSFLSPCVFPLVPTFAAVVSGISLSELRSPSPEARSRVRRATFANGLLFVAGFSLVFIALGASATALGELLYDYRDWIARIGGVFLAVLGLHLLGVFRLPFMDREFRHHFDNRPAGYGGTFLIGVAFGAGWTPCIGPALASILTLTAAGASLGEGMGLLAVYSLGLAVPFLIATVMLDRFMVNSTRIRPWLPRLERASGVLILIIAALLFTDAMSRLAELGTWSPI
jgi:cytochrome c-type biogenesis protein